jgi:peptide methionine sulfoxide reductase MsrA
MMFFEMHDPDKCVTVNLDHERYRKIVFEVEDKEATAKQINDALKSKQ